MQDGLRDALQRLRDEAAAQSASPALESRLMESFRAHHRRKQRHRGWLWIPAAIAATVAFMFVLRQPEPQRRSNAGAIDKPLSAAAVEHKETPTASAPQSDKGKAPPRNRRTRPVRRPPLSVASIAPTVKGEEPFVRIPYAPPFTPYDEGQILRVNMAGASVRRMGIPVEAQQVQADLLVGSDGLPRAVRVVSHTSGRYE